MVNFFRGAAFQGFKTLEDAQSAWLNGLGWLPGWIPPVLSRAPIITSAGLPPAAAGKEQDAPFDTTSPSSSPSSTSSSSPYVSARGSPSPPTTPQLHKLDFVPPPDALDVSLAPAPMHKLSSSRMTGHSYSIVHTPHTNTQSIATMTTSSIIVAEGRTYAVIRGDYPGVYMDK